GEGEVEAARAEPRMDAFLGRHHAVVAKPGGPSPDDDVAVGEADALGLAGPPESPEEKDRRQAQRDRHDRGVEVALVLVLVQGQAGPRLVAVDEAGGGGGAGGGASAGGPRRGRPADPPAQGPRAPPRGGDGVRSVDRP